MKDLKKSEKKNKKSYLDCVLGQVIEVMAAGIEYGLDELVKVYQLLIAWLL